jgi:hypothetical protein
MSDQTLMIDDLKDFLVKVGRLRSGKLDLAEMTAILEGLFGSATSAIPSFFRGAQMQPQVGALLG